MALLVSKSSNGFDIFKADADGKAVGDALWNFASEAEAHSKCYAEDPGYMYVPYGTTTLAGAFAADEARAHANQIGRVVSAYKRVLDYIVWDEELDDKESAIKSLTAELVKVIGKTAKKSTGASTNTTGTWSTTVSGNATWVAGKSGPELNVPNEDGAVLDQKSIQFKTGSTDRIGAYAVLWGSETKKDLDGEFFTEKTEELTKIFDAVGKLPLLYQHTADAVLKTHVLGIVDTLKADSVGLWYEAQLLMSSEYDEWVKKLIQSGKLKTSSQTFPNAKDSNKTTGEITRWPIVEITATPTPAEYRMPPLEILKSVYDGMDCGEKFDGIVKQYVESNDQGAVKARLLLELTRLQLELAD